ncbi:hypothetical protein D1007_03433 [Hordeum vulgare]|nr:hypothetical protein D1007_03433 [Hordeum vulgare]KAI4983857.1 hypothetical protein ZWY2020_025723 [Hordeum vulgare]
MVYEDESNDENSSLPYLHSTSSSTDGLNQVPISLEDPYYKGLELDVFCEKHGKALERLVAFEGTYIGRRFLACVETNLKLENMKEKELVSEARMNLELKNGEFAKFEEKLSQEKLELKFRVADLLKGKEKHNEDKYMLVLKIVELMKAVAELKEKIKGTMAILHK